MKLPERLYARIALPLLLLSGSLLLGGNCCVADDGKDQLHAPTHRQVRVIEPKIDGKTPKLHTIATTADGNLLAAVGGKSMQFVMSEESAVGYETKFLDEPSLVLLLDSEGTTLRQWELELTPTAMTVAPDGRIYVGGSGRIAMLDEDGGVSEMIDSPHVGSVEELRQKTKQSILDSRKLMSGSFDSQIEMLQDRIDAIEEKEEEDRTRLEDAQLKAFKIQLKSLEKLVGPTGDDEDEEPEIESSELDMAMMRSMSVTSMAASDGDLFVCAADPGRGGYSIWRISRDLDADSSERIMDGLRGCCGQMDIQCCGEDLMISENTKFRVGIYDRNGRSKASFGRRDRTSRAGFGSCCNPMNSMAMSDGTILTAESSIGHIKRFDAEGNLVAYIGKAKIGGGCKHCALGYDEKNDLYYMMYEDTNGICVMANSESTPMTLAEKQAHQRQIDFLARAAGHWSINEDKKEDSGGGGLLALFGGGRGGSSQHAVASLQISTDGSAKILEGMYKAYGDKSELELLEENDDDSNTFAFALAIDQVRFLEGTWKFDSDDTASISFQGQSSVTMKRSADSDECETKCAGASCENESCTEKGCPNAEKLIANNKTTVAEMKSDVEADLFETDLRLDLGGDDIALPGISYSTAYASPKFEYKLLTKKQLGESAEEKLNELGAQGWEYCGQIGKKLMFKRVGGMVMAEANDK